MGALTSLRKIKNSSLKFSCQLPDLYIKDSLQVMSFHLGFIYVSLMFFFVWI